MEHMKNNTSFIACKSDKDLLKASSGYQLAIEESDSKMCEIFLGCEMKSLKMCYAIYYTYMVPTYITGFGLLKICISPQLENSALYFHYF